MAINKNQVVKMFYEVKLDDEIIDTNMNAEPIKFVYGANEVVPGLEKGISNMQAGETKDISVPAKDAYGPHNPELSETLPISDFDGIELEIGMVLEADMDDGETLKATVTEIEENEVTVDYNHPLAGCDLDFKVKIHEIL